MICQTVPLTPQEIFCRLKNFVIRITKIVTIAFNTVSHRMMGFFSPQGSYLDAIIPCVTVGA
jgi:hypothetical protein